MVKTCRVKTMEQFDRAIKESEEGDIIWLSNPFPLGKIEVLDSDDVNWFEVGDETIDDVSGDDAIADVGLNVRDRT